MVNCQLKIKSLCLLCIISLLLLTVSGCAAKYTVKTEPVHGKVVDAETNEPIKDVIVIGYWPGYTFYLEQYPKGTIELIEVLTDTEGKYFVPGWQKKNLDSSFRYGDPEMIFYKNGYEIVYESNAFSMENFKKMPGYFHPWRAEWSGKTIKLKKYKGSNLAYRKYLNTIHYSAPFEDIFKDCKYLNLPWLLITMEEYYQTQPDYNLPGSRFTLDDSPVKGSYRVSSNTKNSGYIKPELDITGPGKDYKPLPKILTITKLEGLGARCEESPTEFLKRITRNEKDFIRSNERSNATDN